MTISMLDFGISGLSKVKEISKKKKTILLVEAVQRFR